MLHCVEKSENPNTEEKEPLTDSKGSMPCKLEEQCEEMQMENNNFHIDNISYNCMTTSHP